MLVSKHQLLAKEQGSPQGGVHTRHGRFGRVYVSGTHTVSTLPSSLAPSSHHPAVALPGAPQHAALCRHKEHASMWASRHCVSPRMNTLCTQQTSPQMLLLPHTCIQHACSAGHAKRVLSISIPEGLGLGCCSHHCQLHGHPLQHSREGGFRDDSASPRQTENGSCSHTCSIPSLATPLRRPVI